MVKHWMAYMVLLLAGAGLLNAQEVDLEKGLVALYLLHGNARNEVADELHGQTSNIDYKRDRFDQPSGCANFNGSNGRITIPHAEALNWDARSESFSISFWVRSAEPQNAGRVQQLLGKWNASPDQPTPFAFLLSDTSLVASVSDGRTTMSCTFENPWDGQWHHIVMVYDHLLLSLSSYRDGAWYESKSVTFSSTTTNEQAIYLGYAPAVDDTWYYTGLLDELFFYDRALLPCEIEALHSGQLLQER